MAEAVERRVVPLLRSQNAASHVECMATLIGTGSSKGMCAALCHSESLCCSSCCTSRSNFCASPLSDVVFAFFV